MIGVVFYIVGVVAVHVARGEKMCVSYRAKASNAPDLIYLVSEHARYV